MHRFKMQVWGFGVQGQSLEWKFAMHSKKISTFGAHLLTWPHMSDTHSNVVMIGTYVAFTWQQCDI